MRPHRALILALCLSASAQKPVAHKTIAAPQPTGPTVLFDTSAGRLTCRLFTREAPVTTARFLALATGTQDWTDSTGAVQHGKPFYDGTALFGATTAITGGDRAGGDKGLAGPPVPVEKTPTLNFERPGLLTMRITKDGESSSRFAIFDHSNDEADGRAAIFGLCDAPSVAIITPLIHTLLSSGNHPDHPVILNKVIVLAPGETAPALTANLPEADVVPQSPPQVPQPLIGPDPTGPIATIETTMGTLTCRLFKETPLATANFIGLATGAKPYQNATTHVTVKGKPFYNGLHFARVIPDFMAQQSDLPGDPSGDGHVVAKFDVETFPGLSFDRPGRLAYANDGPNTNESEFFITELPTPFLNDHYTIFGQCDPDTVKVVATIARVPRDAHNKPLTPVTIKSVTIH